LIFEPTSLAGVYRVRIEPLVDERGFFARTWCRLEFAAHGVGDDMVQTSVSYNRHAGTLRGMHFARPPSNEHKLVRCSQGRVFDAVIDLRPDSSTYRQSLTVELDAAEHDALFVPACVAHGFQTLVDHSEVTYMMTEVYRPEWAEGVRYDDPAFGLVWPLAVSVIAERDRSYPGFDDAAHRHCLGGR
jgi:dTDP-4-dehydrorhamnose 3,5-epimerase